jgi:hypothetical protein
MARYLTVSVRARKLTLNVAVWCRLVRRVNNLLMLIIIRLSRIHHLRPIHPELLVLEARRASRQSTAVDGTSRAVKFFMMRGPGKK